ncbi:expressed unknown protein [Seminavis robusta]|uniref:Uncharacterized protein n=1 Tax=Seminavis robusta TaxID=568900 RepID=A0A9N8HWW7_9STRA|nr:expressed unknown protein [Seminavis robusta]|eukprot:Sro2064_g313110.1 n/a (406) ;mRNA; f:4233-5450
MTRLYIADYDNDSHTVLVHLCELQYDLSPLHNLVVTGAPLEVVQLVYEHDTTQMNKDIFLDACRHNASPEVMEFLKSLLPRDACTESDISGAMMDIINDTDNIHNNQDDRFRVLLSWCPQAALAQRYGRFGSDSPLFATLCESNDTRDTQVISEDVIADIIQSIPNSVTEINVPIDHREVTCRRHQVFRAALNAKLKETTALEDLTIQLYHQDQIDRNSRDTICDLISSGKLKSLTVKMTKNASGCFFVPNFDTVEAAGSASSLTQLLFDLVFCACTKQDILFFQDRMIEVLKANTSLTRARISFYSHFMSVINTEISGNETLINYFSLLNRYGRGVMRAPEKSLRDVVEKLAACTSESGPGLSVLYGLLREAPGKWSAPAVQLEKEKAPAGNTPSRKRKANSLD